MTEESTVTDGALLRAAIRVQRTGDPLRHRSFECTCLFMPLAFSKPQDSQRMILGPRAEAES
jgi:hypothetical protein